jgi:arginyl-tRNA synthetase
MEQLQKEIEAIISGEFAIETEVKLTIPDEQFGDVSTNVAMQLAGQLVKNPREIAEVLQPQITALDAVESVAVAGPGFLNLHLTDLWLLANLKKKPEQIWAEKTVVCEYSDPNPFKVLHAGHLYTTLVGDAVANLFAVAGANIVRANFGGDVGLHVAKAMWGIMREIGEQDAELALLTIDKDQRPNWVSARYVEGNTAYEEDSTAKDEIIEINKKVYELHANKDISELQDNFAKAYWICRKWSYDGFAALYDRLGVHQFDVYYPESVTAGLGLQAAHDALKKGVLVESDGAVVFKGEEQGLHTRVFINSNGLPTYESKDLGLALKKWQDYTFDHSVMITGNDIVEYMKVIKAVVRTFAPEIADRTQHITHGMIRLAGGKKMSSRKGNVLLAQEVIDVAEEANKQATGNEDMSVVLGAIKWAFLKNRIGGDIIYDPEESVSIVGNSGPYMQYAHARACSILRKAGDSKIASLESENFETEERSLLRTLSQFTYAVNQAVAECAPHIVCTYLYELAQHFNSFYEHNRVIGDSRESIRLALIKAYKDTLSEGLSLLGIHAPEQM